MSLGIHKQECMAYITYEVYAHMNMFLLHDKYVYMHAWMQDMYVYMNLQGKYNLSQAPQSSYCLHLS